MSPSIYHWLLSICFLCVASNSSILLTFLSLLFLSLFSPLPSSLPFSFALSCSLSRTLFLTLLTCFSFGVNDHGRMEACQGLLGTSRSETTHWRSEDSAYKQRIRILMCKHFWIDKFSIHGEWRVSFYLGLRKHRTWNSLALCIASPPPI